MVYTYELTKDNFDEYSQEFFKMSEDMDRYQERVIPVVLHKYNYVQGVISDDEYFRNWLFDKNNKVYLLKEGEIVIGFIMLTYDKPSKILNISSIYIKEPFRGKGIATNILKDLIKDLIKEVKHSTVIKGIVLSVFEGNENARSLYQKLGFKDWAHSMYLIP